MKDFIRDYATEAFRFYARNGRSSEKYRQMIYLEALANEQKKETGSSTISKPTEAAIMRAELAVEEEINSINDMEAVDMVLAELEANKRRDLVQAIEIIYFQDPEEELKKGDISARVIKAAHEVNAGEATIYRGLKKARLLFAQRRGLRTQYSKKEMNEVDSKRG